MSKVIVPLAEGCEEVEAITVIDLLRRAGIDVTAAALECKPVQCSRGVVILPDASLDDVLQQPFDAVVLPGGGPGSERLDKDARVRNLVANMAEHGKLVAAICAAPKILAHLGLLAHRKATAYPGVLEELKIPGVSSTGAAVEVDGNIVTSRGLGTAIDFALKLVEIMAGRSKRDAVEKGLVR